MSEKILMTSFSRPEIKDLVKEALKEIAEENAKKFDLTKTLSINQTSKILGVSFSTVKKLILNNSLKTTSDNRRVLAWSLNEYLGK